MARELLVFMSEPLAVRPRAASGARPITRHGSQLWWHWARAQPLADTPLAGPSRRDSGIMLPIEQTPKLRGACTSVLARWLS